MTTREARELTGTETQEESISRYLQHNPDFFERHQSLLARLRLPHVRSGSTISLVERQVEVLRERAEVRQRDEADQKVVVDTLGVGLKAIAEGNLTHRINSNFATKYEGLRADFNDAIQELCGVIGQVAGAAASVNTGSSEISTAADDLARRTEQQAASLEETAAAMNEVTVGVRNASANARTANDAVAQTLNEAATGGKVVDEAVSAMGDIEKSAQEGDAINHVDNLRDLLKHALLGQGHEVHVAEDGVSALDWLNRNVPDLVITDINMPNMDGWSYRSAALARPLPRYADSGAQH